MILPTDCWKIIYGFLIPYDKLKHNCLDLVKRNSLKGIQWLERYRPKHACLHDYCIYVALSRGYSALVEHYLKRAKSVPFTGYLRGLEFKEIRSLFSIYKPELDFSFSHEHTLRLSKAVLKLIDDELLVQIFQYFDRYNIDETLILHVPNERILELLKKHYEHPDNIELYVDNEHLLRTTLVVMAGWKIHLLNFHRTLGEPRCLWGYIHTVTKKNFNLFKLYYTEYLQYKDFFSHTTMNLQYREGAEFLLQTKYKIFQHHNNTITRKLARCSTEPLEIVIDPSQNQVVCKLISRSFLKIKEECVSLETIIKRAYLKKDYSCIRGIMVAKARKCLKISLNVEIRCDEDIAMCMEAWGILNLFPNNFSKEFVKSHEDPKIYGFLRRYRGQTNEWTVHNQIHIRHIPNRNVFHYLFELMKPKKRKLFPAELIYRSVMDEYFDVIPSEQRYMSFFIFCSYDEEVPHYLRIFARNKWTHLFLLIQSRVPDKWNYGRRRKRFYNYIQQVTQN